MVVSTATMWTCRVVLGVYLAKYMGLGVLGAWYAMFVDWFVRLGFFIVRYRGHRWELKALTDD